MTERMLTLRQVAQTLNVSTRSVSRWIRAGQLEGVRTPGGHWRVPQSALEDMLRGTATPQS